MFQGFIDLESGDTFGISGLMDEDQPYRRLAVRTLKNCHLLVIDHFAWQALLRVYDIRRKQDVLNFLRSIILLENFTYTALKKSVDLFTHGSCLIRGSHLYKQGAPANYVYIIKSGEFLVTKRRVVIDT